MSILILQFAKSFVNGHLTAEEFANAFMVLWKIERDSGSLSKDDDLVSECLSTIFCLADSYNGDEDRKEYEFNVKQLRKKIDLVIKEFKL